MKVRVRDGLLSRLRTQVGITSDEAFARLLGTSRATLTKVRGGEQPSMTFVAAIVESFGLGFGEVVELVHDDEVVAS